MTALRSVLLFVALLLASLPGAQAAGYPNYDHVVIVVEENHGYSQIVGDTTNAPYINGLLSSSAVFNNYSAVTHPSEPNYFALYAGSTFGVTDDGTYSEPDPSQYTLLKAKSKTFKGYIETGSPQKHNPWESFPEGTTVEANFSTWPSSNYASLPHVAWVIPNLNDDMHDGTVLQGDTWLKNNLDGYLQWAKAHNSLLIVVFDEDDSSGTNRVLAFAAGAHINAGSFNTALNHYGLLRTVQTMFGATAPGSAATATPLPTTAFNTTAPASVPVPLGAYLGNIDGGAVGTPNTTGYYPGFDTQYDNFVKAMGRAPTLYEVYYDVTLTALGQNGWANYTNYLTGIIAGDTRTKNVIPVVGWPLGNTADGSLFYPTDKISAGTYDTEIKNALANWKAGGYSTLYLRPNWEFNLSNPYGLTSANQSNFIASWQHFATLVHNYAAANGMNIKIIWNPNVGPNQNSGASPNAVNVSTWYPGDAYVDVYGIDTYGSPVDSGHEDPSTTTTDPAQYLVTTMFSMAKASGKPVSFDEVGGLDTTFANNMVNYLTGQSPNTAPIEFFSLWSNNDQYSGYLSWTDPWDNQAALPPIWSKGFGASATVTNAVTTNKVVAPLTIPVSKGTWVLNQSITVAAMPNGYMRYNYLLPQGYDPNGSTIYPILIYGHENDEGMNGSTYPADGGGLVNQTVIDGTFNTVAFRTNFPAIIIVPEADQSLDTSGANGNANFGGYADTPNSGGNEQAIVALTKFFLANFKADPTQVYCTGDSLGAIGCLSWLVDNNSINGVNKLFTAGMAFSDQLYRPNGVSNSTVFTNMKTVPLLVIPTPNDNNPSSYDLPAWTAYTGNSTYPTGTTYSSKGVAGLKAGTSNFYLLNTTSGVPWDTYRQLNADGGQGTALYTWLFSNGANATPPPAGGGNGHFTVSNGQIHDPQGRNWIAHGINVYDSAMGSVSTDTTGQPLTTLFPGINFIRLATYQYSDATYFQTFVDQMSALGIVVEIEHHSGAGGGVPPLTGQALTDENNWFKTIAAAFKDNPYVWFGTLNEPSGPGSDLSAEQLANYNAIRNAGNDNPIMLEPLGDYGSGVLVVGDGHGLVTADYANMTNVIWDFHFYDGLPDFNANNGTNSYSNDPKVLTNLLSGYISQSQTIQSKDGLVPVIIGEYGPATDGQNNDPGGDQTVTVVEQSGVGSAAWNWASGAPADNLTDGSNHLTTYGKTVAAWIATNTSGGEGLTLNAFGPEPQNTPFTVAGNISGVTAAPALQYQDNGGAWQALPSGATVTATAFSFTNPGLPANPTAKVAVRDANNTSISVVSPAFVVSGAASPNNTVVTTVGPAITDALGNTWTLTSGGQVAVNGTADTTTSNVIELAYVSGDVWQENNQNLWWYKTKPSDQWTPTNGTTVSPLPQGGSEALTVANVATQTSGATFTVSGTITGVSAAPLLQYQDDGGTWQNLPGSTIGTRKYTDQPGGNNSAWNLAFGKDATWGLATDLDTIDIARGYNNGYTAGPVGIINPPTSYGQTVWVGQSTDSTVTFSSSNNGRSQAPDNGATITATVHLPTGAYAPGPYPGDNPMVIEDPTNYPGRQYTFGGVNLQPPGFKAGQGPFTGSAGEWDDATSDLYGEDQETGLNGYNIGAGLITGCDTDATCNPSFPKIKHGLRYSTDAHLLKTNDNGDGSTLKPDSWPQRLQDGQSGINVYSGNLKAGTTLGIPSTTVMPTGLDANCQGLFWTFQHYPLFWRDQAGGGFHLSDDQVADGSTFIASARSCLPQLVGLLRPLRNQHQGGQSFVDHPANGPGARVDAGPPGLVGTGSPGANVTTTSYSFVHPGMVNGTAHTIVIRDANNPTVQATSNSFTVASPQPEHYSINAIAGQTAGVAFTVSGSITGDTSPPLLQYQDNGGNWLALPSGSTVTATSFSFTNPGLAATSSAKVSVRNANATAVSATSNTFAVTTTPVESLSINTLTGQRVGIAFTVSGTVANAPAGLALQYEDNNGAWQPLPTGASITGAPGTATFSFINPAPTLTNPTATVGVRDASATSVSGVSNTFTILPATSPTGTIVTTVGPAVVDTAGESFTITTGAQVAVNGTADTSTSNVKALAFVSGTVWYENTANLWFGKTQAADAWAPPNGTSTSPLSTESLGINTIGPQTQGVAFSASGTIANALVAPSLQYSVAGGPWTAFPAAASVTISNFAVVIPGIATTGPTTVAVRDANNTAISATSNSFTVNTAAGEALTIQPIGNHAVGAAFAVSGAVVGLTAAPPLQYQDNGGPWMPLPAGAAVTSAGYNFVHPGLPASQGMVVAVRDASHPTVSVAAPSFVITAQESPNLTVVTTQGPQIVDGFGIPYTLTAGKQVAINGVPDTTTANVIELAYVNRQVWYENSNLDWWSRTFSGNWGPTGGTLLGPLPSSKPTVYLTSSQPLAVVPGFTIAVPGVVINDTVISGNFVLTITAVDGVLTMPGATGTGTAKLSFTGSLSAVNAALKQLQFTGKTVGTGSVTILAVDPAGIAATASVVVKVPRAAAAKTPG